MIEQGVNAKALVLGSASGAVSMIFGTEVALVFAGFSGALISLALTGPRGFAKAAGWVTSGTVAAAFISPLAIHYLGSVPSRGVAFLVGFAVMHFLPASLEVIRAIPSRLSDKFFGDKP